MDLPVNRFKRALREGRPQIGLWSVLANAGVTELLGAAGFDWLCIDMEHAPNELPDVQAQLQALRGAGATPIVRPPWNDMVWVKRVLDLGAQTLLIPYVQTAEEAAQAVSYMRYPPAGRRGVAGGTRATQWGRIRDYYKCVEEELCLLVQVESRQGLENLDAIAATPGVDGVFVGPADLSADMGHLGDPQHSEVQAAIEDALRRIRASGKAAGILARGEEGARRWIGAGCNFVAVGVDAVLLAQAADGLAAKFRT
ncbi:MAG: HpcH/HpaI aldolase/citrate lyase family protein [Rhodocyclaceae bacterium]|jgi:4-hydroxy-2-oxoheptanedioate aldolase|nr:HpcH/HpaI aldolase/citrate lyase family protein [Rhodocyclaceae bacterium]